MNVGELREALGDYSPDVEVIVAVVAPDRGHLIHGPVLHLEDGRLQILVGLL